MCKKFALAMLVCALAPAFVSAEVSDSSANVFTIKIVTTIHAAPADVYDHLLRVGDWWDPNHTFSHDAHNLSIEERAGGCYCEKLTDGGVRHGEVVYFVHGKMLRISTAMGPMQTLGVAGALTFTVSPSDGATKLEVTYAVGGYLHQGLDTFADPVNGVLSQQIARLKSLIETGKAEPEKKP